LSTGVERADDHKEKVEDGPRNKAETPRRSHCVKAI
jgi:hypothetical protein